jgi:hypothetical protein
MWAAAAAAAAGEQQQQESSSSSRRAAAAGEQQQQQESSSSRSRLPLKVCPTVHVKPSLLVFFQRSQSQSFTGPEHAMQTAGSCQPLPERSNLNSSPPGLTRQ